LSADDRDGFAKAKRCGTWSLRAQPAATHLQNPRSPHDLLPFLPATGRLQTIGHVDDG
jgi:hypothetical protein